MIYIEERVTSKLPGLTSLFIKFNYDKDIIGLLKNCLVYHYDKNTKEWEIPITYLFYIVDNLQYFDDLEVSLLEENQEVDTYQPQLVDTYSYKPFQYQLDGIQYGLNHDKWLLLDAPGLGKTYQIIHLAEELKTQKGLEHCLIVCGLNSLKSNWKREIEKHSNLSCTILGERITKRGNYQVGSLSDRLEHLKKDIQEFFIITNIETLRDDNIIKELIENKNNIDMIVIDEAQRIKNISSQQTKNFLKLKNFKYKIAATGTLIVNNPLDAYCALKFIDNENSNYTTFKNFYCIMSPYIRDMPIGYRHIDLIKEQISGCSLRRDKDLLDLPPKQIIHELIDMNQSHIDLYNAVREGIKEELDKIQIKNNSIRALATRFRQATSCPSVLTSTPIQSNKVERALDLIEQIVENGDKVVVFSSFKAAVYDIYDKVKSKYNTLAITGDTKEEDVQSYITSFQNNPETKVLVATWQKLGTGQTLTAANYMIFIDTPYTPAECLQAEDRIYRIGSNKKVFIYYLWCKDTFDERIKEIIETKSAITNYMEDNINEGDLEILRRLIKEEFEQV